MNFKKKKKKLLKFILKWDPCLIVTQDKRIWHRHLTGALPFLIKAFLVIEELDYFLCWIYRVSEQGFNV